jgi:hypothetical protein
VRVIPYAISCFSEDFSPSPSAVQARWGQHPDIKGRFSKKEVNGSNRSVAIAHNLEYLCPAAPPKAMRGRKAKTENLMQ